MNRADSEIREAVLSELKWDSRVEEADVDVKVEAGVVILTGIVSSWAKRIAVQEAAHRVAGVLDVTNDVEVRVWKSAWRTDADLAHAVRHALEWDVFIPQGSISSTVSDGRVTLEGEVDYWSQREDAESAVRNLAGVRHVFNRIQIKPSLAVPQEVQRSIEEALARRAEHPASRVNLDVDHGRVVLSGVVASAAERRLVVGAARATRGVRSVDDRLRVEP